MKNLVFLVALSMLFICDGFANNLVIGSPTINGSTVSFTIKWDNSWKVSTGPSNWDAVWVFVKRQNCDGALNPWVHADLSGSGHSVTNGVLQVDLASDNKGVFIRRQADGIGNISQATVTLTLTSAIGSDNIQIFGLEMVYVPQGSFYIGDGNKNNSNNPNYQMMGNAQWNPVQITSSLLSSHSANGMPASVYGGGQALGSTVNLPSTYPFGYNAFYCMKYEITADIYISFLNSLTYNQQLRMQQDYDWNRTPPTSNSGTSFMENWGYKIVIDIPGVSTNMLKPAVYAANANNNGTYNEACDGLGLPVALNKRCYLAFMDWAALRPMTEFEYEKACRGPVTPVAGEMSWGTTDFTNSYNISNRFCQNESNSNFYLGLSNAQTGVSYRAGIEATASTDRVHAGATYYGILNMTGSTFERCVGSWGYDYSVYTTQNGDGNIASDGQTDITIWSNMLYNMRGSSFQRADYVQMSRRDYSDDNSYGQGGGGRGVRSF